MKKILAFAGSNSTASINRQLLENVLKRMDNLDIEQIRLTDFSLPIFSVDLEKRGIPENVLKLQEQIDRADALVVAVNEHNGGPSTFFKNTIDWLSRNRRDFLQDKKILLISTSPGARGAKSSLEYTERIFGRFGGEVLESFSFPSFKDNFHDGKVINEVLDMGIQDVVTTFAHQISE
ncbi:MAG: NADPH-dependent FMN reductase [Christiangramia sp.]|nr:NADPH-dependent FMN reductase [Christiangramia sp.]